MPLNPKEQGGNDTLSVSGRKGRSFSMVASPKPGLFGRNRAASDASPRQARASLARASLGAASKTIPTPRTVHVEPAPSSNNLPEMAVVQEEDDDCYECDVRKRARCHFSCSAHFLLVVPPPWWKTIFTSCCYGYVWATLYMLFCYQYFICLRVACHGDVDIATKTI